MQRTRVLSLFIDTPTLKDAASSPSLAVSLPIRTSSSPHASVVLRYRSAMETPALSSPSSVVAPFRRAPCRRSDARRLPGDGAELVVRAVGDLLLEHEVAGRDGAEDDGGDELVADRGGEDVHLRGVGHVRLEALQGGGAGDGVLRHHAEEGHHREAAVLDLLHLHGGGVLAGGVEGEVAHHAGLAGGHEAADARSLEEAHHHDLDRDEGLDVPVAERGLASLPELGQTHGVREEDARGGVHRPAAVHELSLLEVGEGLGVLAEAQGVEAVVARHGTVEVRGGLGAGQPVLGTGGGLDGHAALRDGALRGGAERDGDVADGGHFTRRKNG
mmetsp:Transcript_10084/g.42895  ORF Transcript_10084/g.42895 Transcript_10084/m.42895 type:complete len:330 (-) Transcript_10084:40-1029(-)